MEFCTLHPIEPETVRRYVAALKGEVAPDQLAPRAQAWGGSQLIQAQRDYERAQAGDETGANAVSLGLASLLATVEPSFVLPGAGLTIWEARIDRGAGMVMRPPSRLFIDAGLDPGAARAMPIRLDLSRGMMGGAYVPARLVPDLQRLLETRMERQLRRLAQAELDGIALLGAMLDACAFAAARGFGLYEAMDAITLGVPEANPPGARLVIADRKRLDPALRRRLEAAAKPPKRPGLVARLFGRGDPTRPSENGREPGR